MRQNTHSPRQDNVEELTTRALRGDTDALSELKKLAENGDAEAQNILGSDYMLGAFGAGKDRFREAEKWFRMLAKRGNAKGQYQLGLLYSRSAYGMEDDVEAVKWYRLSAEQGAAAAQQGLADMYAKGKGVKQDYEEAYFWSYLAARSIQTGPQSTVQAMNNLMKSYVAHLTPDQKAAVDKRVAEWNPVTATTPLPPKP